MTEKRLTLTLEDLKRIQIKDFESDPESLFTKRPDLKTRRRSDYIGDSETVSLFWSYGSKINRLSKSDRRLQSLRV